MRRMLSLALFCGLAAPAIAQPGNPTPASYVDLGDLSIGQTKDSGDQVLPAGLYVWFRFRLTSPINASTWLDLDTLGPTVIQNDEAALYDNRKNKIAEDNDSGGSGTAGNNYAAAMSFGGGSGQRLSLDPPGGVLSDGFSGQNLPTGVYWVCLAAYDTVFPDPNNNWDTTTSSTTTGNVRLKLTTGAVPAGVWNERQHGDAGDMPETAQVVEGDGPLSTILTSFNPGGRDMFKIRICSPASFQVTAESTTFGDGGGGNYGTRLFLFDATGRGVAAINRCTSATTTLTAPPGLAVGDYYLAVSSNCGGTNTFQASPYTASGQLIWDFSPSPTCNVVIAPNGPGAGQPIGYWGRQADCNTAGSYVVKLSLTGACYTQSTGCYANCDGSTTPPILNVSDFICFLNRYSAGCP